MLRPMSNANNQANDNATPGAGFAVMVNHGASIPRTRFTISVDGVSTICLWSKNLVTAGALASRLLNLPVASIRVRRIRWNL
jgi:hypothetical protein